MTLIGDPKVNGSYEATRAPGSPFPTGTRLPAIVQEFRAVKGVSADRLTLLMFDTGTRPYSTAILSRADVAAPFANPNAPHAPPSVPGFRNVFLDDCGVLLGNYTTNGCRGEDIYLFKGR